MARTKLQYLMQVYGEDLDNGTAPQWVVGAVNGYLLRTHPTSAAGCGLCAPDEQVWEEWRTYPVEDVGVVTEVSRDNGATWDLVQIVLDC